MGFPPTNQLPSCQQPPRHCSLCLSSEEDLFLETSCPGDINVSSKEEEKVCKYSPLATDFHLMYRMVVEVIPIVFGHTGVVSTDCVKYLTKIPGYCESLFATSQKATILGTIHTL